MKSAMKRIFIPIACIACFWHTDVSAQTPLASSSTPAPNSARAGLEQAIQPQPASVVNLLNMPIAIEQDLAADHFFRESLKSYDKKDNLIAARQIRDGAQELLKEAPVSPNNPDRKLVEQRVGELYALSLKVEAGKVDDREVLQNAFADADESLAHRYYEGARTLIGGTPDAFADRLLGLSVHLRNSKEYHKPAEKAAIGKVSDDAAALAADIRKMKPGEQELSPELKARLDKIIAATKQLKLDQ